MMARGSGNRREEEQEDNGPHMSDPMYDEEENIETLDGKVALSPLWNYVTKPEGGKGGGSYKFLCRHGCQGGKPYIGSYTHERSICVGC